MASTSKATVGVSPRSGETTTRVFVGASFAENTGVTAPPGARPGSVASNDSAYDAPGIKDPASSL